MNKAELRKKLVEFKRLREELKEVGCYAFHDRFGEITYEFQVGLEDLIRLPFYEAKNVEVHERGSDYYTFAASIVFEGVSFEALVTDKKVAKYFPEYVEQTKPFVVIEGVKYIRVQDCEE